MLDGYYLTLACPTTRWSGPQPASPSSPTTGLTRCSAWLLADQGLNEPLIRPMVPGAALSVSFDQSIGSDPVAISSGRVASMLRSRIRLQHGHLVVPAARTSMRQL